MRKYMNRWVIPLSRLPHLPGLPNLKLNRLYFIKLVRSSLDRFKSVCWDLVKRCTHASGDYRDQRSFIISFTESLTA